MKSWQFDFEQYSKQGEMDKKEKAYAWKTAIGLQDVDGLKPSEYLIETAKEHIEGNVDLSEVKYRIDSYYETQTSRLETRVEEADKVSLRITEILGEKTFNFSPAELFSIHKRMFSGIYKHAGKARDYNISKKEWVLNNESVFYASTDSINATLDYDFSQEKEFSYEGLPVSEAVKHIAKFTSDIWQVHPFGEGNTRTTAVFIIKYLRTFGFNIDNDLFADNSWYFRNALVRANYNDIPKGIHETTSYLEMFFQNLLLNEQHELKNRIMLVGEKEIQSAISKCNDCTLEEIAVLDFLKREPTLTQRDLAQKINKSERTVKTITTRLQKKGFLKRENGRRNGKWVVL